MRELRTFLHDGPWIETIAGALGDDACDAADEHVAKPLLQLLCMHTGHAVISDMCGKPEHDYCTHCMELQPGRAGEAPRG